MLPCGLTHAGFHRWLTRRFHRWLNSPPTSLAVPAAAPATRSRTWWCRPPCHQPAQPRRNLLLALLVRHVLKHAARDATFAPCRPVDQDQELVTAMDILIEHENIQCLVPVGNLKTHKHQQSWSAVLGDAVSIQHQAAMYAGCCLPRECLTNTNSS